jgi:hypothetical protein
MDKTVSDYMREQGRKGGQAKTPAKAAASAANGAKGGRPKMRRVEVTANNGDGMTVEIILRDGKTATRSQYESALRRLGAAEGDYLRLANESGDIVVWDGDKPWATLS